MSVNNIRCRFVCRLNIIITANNYLKVLNLAAITEMQNIVDLWAKSFSTAFKL